MKNKKAIRRNLDKAVLRELRGGQQPQPPLPGKTGTLPIISIKC